MSRTRTLFNRIRNRGARRCVSRSILALTVVAAAAVPSVLPGPARASDALKVIGELPWMSGRNEVSAPGLVIDHGLHRGFLVESGQPIRVYDLVTLRDLGELEPPPNFQITAHPIHAVDPVRHRAYFVANPRGNEPGCGGQEVFELDTARLTWRTREVPCLGAEGFVINGISYDTATQRLYAVGFGSFADAAYSLAPNAASVPGARQPAIYRQIDPETFAADWTVDATASCEWHQLFGGGTVVRTRDSVIGYCVQGGTNERAGAGQGVALRIPMQADKPVGYPAAPVIETSLTYRDPSAVRLVDPETSRLILISRSRPFGPAAWVYDTHEQAFLGVVPAGVHASETGQGFPEIFFGFNAETGRLYLHTVRGFVVLDARHSPLPGGVSHAALAGPMDTETVPVAMPIDPGLGRVFVKVRTKKAWVVVADNSAPAPARAVPDPDSGTADIEEGPGTDRTFSGSAGAYGVHALNVGGVPVALQRATWRADCLGKQAGAAACATEAMFSPGNREFFLARATGMLGSDSGVRAMAVSAGASERDFATDADIRAAGECHAARFESMAPGTGKPLADQCPQQTPKPLAELPFGVTFEAMRGGTRGADGKGFPIPASDCADFGQGTQSADAQSSWLGTSTTSCDSGKSTVGAVSDASALSVGGGVVHVGRTSTSVTSQLDPVKGLVTTSTAVAEGVTIAGVASIKRVTTQATTSARGRSGTAAADYTRTFEGVRAGRFACEAHCAPEAVETALNDALAHVSVDCSDPEAGCEVQRLARGWNDGFGRNVFVRVPRVTAVATPKGYTGAVSKYEPLVVSDRAINDDETVEATALDIIVNNDYYNAQSVPVVSANEVAGRSRLVVSLAGVQAEAHYGVFPLPKSGDAETTAVPGEDAPAAQAALAGGPYAIGPAPPAPLPSIPAQPPGSARPSPTVGAAVAQALRLIVNDPGQAALLALFLAILVAPVYFAVRRRAVASVWRV